MTNEGLSSIQVGGLLRAARKRQGLTTTQVAERLGVSQALVSLVETGKRLPALGRLRDWFEVLGMPEADRKRITDAIGDALEGPASMARIRFLARLARAGLAEVARARPAEPTTPADAGLPADANGRGEPAPATIPAAELVNLMAALAGKRKLLKLVRRLLALDDERREPVIEVALHMIDSLVDPQR